MEHDKLKQLYESIILEFGQPPTNGENYAIIRSKLYNKLQELVKMYISYNIGFDEIIKDLEKLHKSGKKL